MQVINNILECNFEHYDKFDLDLRSPYLFDN